MIFKARQAAVTIVGQFCIEARHAKNLLEVFSVDSAWRHIRCSLAAVIKNPIAKKSLGPQVSSLLRIIGSACVWVAAYVLISTGNCATGSTSIGSPLTDANPLAMPSVGDYGLRVLSPTVLELTLINSKNEDPARVPNWDFVSDTFSLSLPATSSFTVTANGQTVGISSTERASIGGMGGFNDMLALHWKREILDSVTELKLSSEPCYVSSGCAALVYFLNRETRFWKTSACRLSGISSLT